MNPNSLLTMTALGKEGTIHLLQEAFLFQKKYTDWQIGSQRGPVANLFLRTRPGPIILSPMPKPRSD